MNGHPISKLHQYFTQHVLPAEKEWRASQLDGRLAMILAGAINNLVDYYWHSTQEGLFPSPFFATGKKDFRKKLSAQSESLQLVRDIADAHKHLVVERADRKISRPDQVKPERVGYGQAYGLCYGGGELLAVSLDNNETKYFVVVVDEAMAFWAKAIEAAIT